MTYNLRNKRNLKKKLPDTDSDSEEENIEFSIDDEDSEDDEEDTEDDDDDDEDDYETCSEQSIHEPVKKSRKAQENNKKKKSKDRNLDEAEIRKEVSKIFPSNYMNERVKKDEKRKKEKKQKKRRKEVEEDDEEDDEDDDEYLPDDDELDNNLFSVIFTSVGEPNFEDDIAAIENDEDEVNSDDEQMFMKENYEKIECPETGSIEEENKKKSSKKKSKKKDADEGSEEYNAEETQKRVELEYGELVETKKLLSEKLAKNPKSKILRHAVEECNVEIKKLVKKSRTKNAKEYYKLIHSDLQHTNEIDYFKRKLSSKEQLNVMNQMKLINSHLQVDKPYRLMLLDSNIPPKFKATVLQKLNVLNSMDPSDNEYYKIKTWVDTFMRVPFTRYKNLSVNMSDGLEACHSYMENAKKILDDCVYGLDDAKLQILQMVGQWISNPSAMGTAVAIHGPMGTGKTTLTKDGISKILGREFAFIALGGAGDSSFLEGHSYTYEGSSWGKIVQILIDSKCMNPVIYFDELDKVSDTPRGQEIIGILTHLTDTSQNSQFHDKYFSEVDFDLSKCLFIFSYNDESKVNPILKDRMYRIHTKGYDAKEKVKITRDYLLPKIREQVNFTEEDIIIPDETIQYLVSNSSLTKGEDGVRNLKRCLEIIYTKLNLFRLVKSDNNMFFKDIDLKVEFPFTVLKKHVDILIKNDANQNQSLLAMYV